MAQQTDRKPNLTHASIVSSAIALADELGLEQLSMRRLAKLLGVQAMSIYHHVANRDALLDGMIDRVFAEITLPDANEPWREAMRKRAASARQVLLGHPWAVGLMDSRTRPGPATLRHHDTVLRNLRQGGFTVTGSATAFSLLDAYVYGYVIQESAMPIETPEEAAAMAQQMKQLMDEPYPYLTEMLAQPAVDTGYTYEREFITGLELILDGLERLQAQEGARP